MKNESLTLTVDELTGVTVITFGADFRHLDDSIVDDAGRQLQAIVQDLASPRVALDLSAVEFFGSSFIEAMFRAWKTLNLRPGAKLGLVGLRPYCREVVEITHLNRLWPLFATADDAFANL